MDIEIDLEKLEEIIREEVKDIFSSPVCEESSIRIGKLLGVQIVLTVTREDQGFRSDNFHCIEAKQ